jgi:hypothetical protein
MKITRVYSSPDGESHFEDVDIELHDAGQIEIEVSDGEVRRFSGGDVLLVEDVDGRGHRTRTTDGNSRRSIFIPI